MLKKIYKQTHKKVLEIIQRAMFEGVVMSSASAEVKTVLHSLKKKKTNKQI
jgi:hypothetical protein